MKRRMLGIGILAVVMAQTVSGCSVKRKLDDMHDSTMHMDRMTERLGKTSDDLKETTCEMFEALKQGDTLARRQESFQAVLNAKQNARKASEAVKYFLAFEFQIWAGGACDTEDARIRSATSAAREFMRDVQDLVHRPLQPRPLIKILDNESSADNEARSLNALALTMHMLNPRQEELRRQKPDIKELSMLTMIQEALTARESIEAGTKKLEEFPGYVAEILSYPDIARHLIQVRYNYMMTVPLRRLANLDAASAIEQGKMLTRHWTVDFKPLDTRELQDIIRYYNGAIRMYDFLKTIGVEPLVDATVRDFYRQMQLPTRPPQANLLPDLRLARPKAESEIVERIGKIKEQVESVGVVDSESWWTKAKKGILDFALPPDGNGSSSPVDETEILPVGP